jgi:hypothetical protein
MGGTAVSIDAVTHAKLREMSAETGRPMIEVLAKAVEAYQRQRFLKGLNADFAALRDNRPAWAEEQAERTAWGATIVDNITGD